MEDNISKRAILLLFAILITSFLFIYKGFFVNGSNYLDGINEYKQSIHAMNQSSNKTSFAQSSLKRTKLSDMSKSENSNGNSNKSKSKIPQELSSIDNNILELKALIQNVNGKHSKVIQSINTIHNSTNSIDDLNEVITELVNIKEQQSTIENNIDELAANVERLREYF